MELIDCHDCRKPVSFTAAQCPHCGSREPAGPYQFSDRQSRRFRIEAYNDLRMVVFALLGAVIGVVYGVHVSDGWLSAVAMIPAYGLLGTTVGLAVAVSVNLFFGPGLAIGGRRGRERRARHGRSRPFPRSE